MRETRRPHVSHRFQNYLSSLLKKEEEEEEERRLGFLILAVVDDDLVGGGVFGGSAVRDIILNEWDLGFTRLFIPFLRLSFILIKLIKS